MDKLENIIREITATRVKIELLCKRVDTLSSKIDKDHEILMDHEIRINNLERWMKNHKAQHNYSLNLRQSILLIALGSFLGAFFSWLFTHIHI